MSIIVTCKSCGETLQAKEEWAGKSVRCPSCKDVLTVPSIEILEASPLPVKAPARRPRVEDDEDYDRPVSKRRRDYDDDDDYVPARRSRRGRRRNAELQDLSEFSPVLVVLLHVVTCGLFSIIWLGLIHGKLPKVRSDDPGAGAAIGFMFIPIFSLYWVFFNFRRLVWRLNEQLEEAGLEPNVPDGFALFLCIMLVIPYVNLIAYGIVLPIFAAIVQSRVNELAQTVNG